MLNKNVCKVNQKNSFFYKSCYNFKEDLHMLIVLDTKTAMARLINQEDLFSTVMLSKLENYFSYAVAESARKILWRQHGFQISIV